MLKINILKTIVLPVVLIASLCFAGVAGAQMLNKGYKSDEPLQTGMLVMETDYDPKKVSAVSLDTLDRILGVVIQKNDSPVTLASKDEKVFVADTGEYPLLVSNENGTIEAGDYISISSLAGVGMKANGLQPLVVGRATEKFEGNGDSIGSTIDNRTNQTINFGRIPVLISIKRNPNFKDEQGNKVPKVLERVSFSIAGKPVNTARIWMATAVFLGSLLVAGIMLYSGARSSLISVGRNPLSRSIIIKGLGQVVVMSIIVFISGMFAVYLLLKV
ncbi:MAG TPA: hypothetical protein VFX79_02015 [Candidatus Saccharimonadales bacterium]|nr:hypothetical protein [Candidatus Saccharimonadales bacterium]